MATTSAYHIAGLLEKMDSPDKDFRFMATSDLITELQRNNVKLDEDSERKVVRKLLKLLEDKNGEVQNLAVKCLGTVTLRIREPQAETVVDALCAQMTTGKEELRDVASIALKTVVGEFSPAMSFAPNTVRRLAPMLAKALYNADSSVRMETLDILSDILFRFGSAVAPQHLQIKEVLLYLLTSERQAVRKRATVALGYLSSSCNGEMFQEIVNFLLEQLSSTKDEQSLRTLVTAVTYVTRASASRFAENLPVVIPMFIQFCEKTEDDEFKESILQSLETFVLRCPREVAPQLETINKLAVHYLKYDPNYCGDYEDETMEISDEEEEDEDYSDDDDMSWKVRRAAAKLIEALVVSRREHVLDSVNTLGTLLISRLREREENVRCDIFAAYKALLSHVSIIVPNSANDIAKEGEESIAVGSVNFAVGALSADQLALLNAVSAQVLGVVRACSRLLRQKSSRTRQLCFELLSQLLKTLPGALSTDLGSILPGVTDTLSDKQSSSQMKIDTLHFLALALLTHTPSVLAPHMGSLVPLIATAMQDSFYKVSSEAISVSVTALPMLADQNASNLIVQLYEATLPKLRATDLDQEVKEKAISSAGLFAARCGDQLTAEQMTELLAILFERCKNEMTRVVALKSLETILHSSLNINLGEENIREVLPLLADFLKKNIRALKMSTLSLLESLLRRYEHPGVECDALAKVLSEVALLIGDEDLLVSQYSLKCIAVAFERFPKHIAPVLGDVLTGFTQLTQSSLIQGPILIASLDMIRSLVLSNVDSKPGFEALLDQLTAPVYDVPNLPKQSFHAISSATAVVAASFNDNAKTIRLCKQLSEQLANPQSTDAIRLFALMTLGELGRRCPSVYVEQDIRPEQLIVDAFNSSNEDLKSGAAYALGAVAVGNLPKFLPFIVDQMRESKRQYLLLHAIKEIILWETSSGTNLQQFRVHIQEMWPVLVAHCECAEEGTRNVVAECIGKLCVLEPELLHQLKTHINSPSANVRAAVVTAVKFTIGAEKRAVDAELHKLMGEFLAAVHDQDLNVRRVAFVALNSAAHNRPSLIRHHLGNVMPVVYSETKVRTELIKEVEMGPFKHLVDDGLDLRKAAFECMFTMLESCLEKLNISEFLTHLEDGLKDQHDIRILAYITVSKLATLTPTHLLQRLEKICDPLKAQLLSKVKSNAVKQEMEKHEELKRTAMRTWLALQEIPDASRQPQLVEIHNTVRSSPELRQMLASVEKESQRTFSSAEFMDMSS